MDLSGLETILVSLHAMGAAIFETPEVALAPSEAKLLSDSIANVSKHYDTGIMTAKQIDWLNLMTALGMIYGTRVMAIKLRLASEAAKDVTPKPQPAKQPPTTPAPAANVFDPLTAHMMQG